MPQLRSRLPQPTSSRLVQPAKSLKALSCSMLLASGICGYSLQAQAQIQAQTQTQTNPTSAIATNSSSNPNPGSATATPLYASPLINNNLYIGVHAGPSFFHAGDDNAIDALYQDHTKTGFNFGGVIGYQFANFLRADISVDYTRNHFTGGTAKPDLMGATTPIAEHNINQVHVLFNGYFQYPIAQTGYKLRPYIGAGIGYGHLGEAVHITNPANTNITSSIKANGGLAWQVSLGANYNLAGNLDLGLGYRLLGTHLIDPNLMQDAWFTPFFPNLIPLQNTLNSIISLSLTYRIPAS